jgi:hypothetical protein
MQPPSAAASRLPSGQPATPSQTPVPAGIQYADRKSSVDHPEQSLRKEPCVAVHAGPFHLSGDNPFESQDFRHPTGTNSPDFLESLRINTRLVSVASLEELHMVVLEEVPSIQNCALGSVNVSSALYRVALLWKEFLEECTGQGCPPAKTPAARAVRKTVRGHRV